jgi:hypothetical protein
MRLSWWGVNTILISNSIWQGSSINILVSLPYLKLLLSCDTFDFAIPYSFASVCCAYTNNLLLLFASFRTIFNMSNSEWNDAEANRLPEKVEKMELNGELPKDTKRKRVVVVGLGMVGVAFM